MPLGASYLGVCRAAGPSGDGQAPPEARQRELCNRGYARGECPCFPPDAPADAVRFSVVSEEPGHVRLLWVHERDHAPVAHGTLSYRDARIEGAAGLLAAQARAFWEGTSGSAARRAAV
jgi:hypothetical protein